MRPLLSLLLLSACTAPGMKSLRAPPAELSDAVDPACEPPDHKGKPADAPDGVDCKDQATRVQTWRSQRGVFADEARLVFLGDAGVRAEKDGKTLYKTVGEGPKAVATHALDTCAGGCDGAVFLGDNLYKSGVNNPDDTAFLRSFARTWDFVGPQWYVQGNHDWGTYPLILRNKARLGPHRQRAQRLFRDLRRLSAEAPPKGKEALDLRGDSHFWATAAGPGRLVALDTNYLVRRCDAGKDRVRCKGDPGKEKPDRIWMDSLVRRSVSSAMGPVIVVGHHPWLSNGEHGPAGDYKDQGFGFWKGEGFRQVLDDVVAPQAALYISGHDHNTQVARIDGDTLSVVVGAGGKTTGPGEDTAPVVDGEPGERHVPVEHEVYCQLGYAVVDVGASSLTVDVHTLPHPNGADEDLVECREALAERRPDLTEPGGETCRRWTWTEGAGWAEGSQDCQ